MVDDKVDLSVRKRLSDVAKSHQDPKDRLWSAIIVLTFITIFVGVLSFISWQSSETGNTITREGQILGFQRGSVDCLTTIIDNDRTFNIPDYCRRNEVVQWYPPEVCSVFFTETKNCGEKWSAG